MDCIYLVVTEKNDLSKGEENLSSALNRYYKYVISESNNMNFRTFGCEMDTQKGEMQILFDLYQYTEKLNQFNVIRLIFSENNNNQYYNNFEVKSFYALDLFKKGFLKKNTKLDSTPKWQIEELIENTYFRKITANFKHRAIKDLVNSELGVLKVWLDNSNNNEKQSLLDNNFLENKIKFSKVKKILKDLENEIGQLHSYENVPQFLSKEIYKKIGLVDSIKNDLFDNTNNEINLYKLKNLSKAKKQNISSKIFKLFSFISEYHEKIEIKK